MQWRPPKVSTLSVNILHLSDEIFQLPGSSGVHQTDGMRAAFFEQAIRPEHSSSFCHQQKSRKSAEDAHVLSDVTEIGMNCHESELFRQHTSKAFAVDSPLTFGATSVNETLMSRDYY